MRRDHDARSTLGLTSAVSTGNDEPASYWPGGRRVSRSPAPKRRRIVLGDMAPSRGRWGAPSQAVRPTRRPLHHDKPGVITATLAVITDRHVRAGPPSPALLAAPALVDRMRMIDDDLA